MLKIAKLPDRTPIKLTISANAILNNALSDYAALYQSTYGDEASVTELIPLMLEAFLKSDPAFIKAQKSRLPQAHQAAKAPLRAEQKKKTAPSALSIPSIPTPTEV